MNMLTLPDKILIGALLIAGLVSVPVLAALMEEGDLLIVQRDGRLFGEYPLKDENTLTISGPLGDTIVSVGRGSAKVIDSPCLFKICVRTGWIHRGGQIAACIPNKIVLIISKGTAKGWKEPDAISR